MKYLLIALLLFSIGCAKGEVEGCVVSSTYVDEYHFAIRLKHATVSGDDPVKNELSGPIVILKCGDTKCASLQAGDRALFKCHHDGGHTVSCRFKTLKGTCK